MHMSLKVTVCDFTASMVRPMEWPQWEVHLLWNAAFCLFQVSSDICSFSGPSWLLSTWRLSCPLNSCVFYMSVIYGHKIISIKIHMHILHFKCKLLKTERCVLYTFLIPHILQTCCFTFRIYLITIVWQLVKLRGIESGEEVFYQGTWVQFPALI